MQALLRERGRLPVTSLGPSSLSLVHAYHVLGPVSAHLSLPTPNWHPSYMVTWEETGSDPGLGALAPSWRCPQAQLPPQPSRSLSYQVLRIRHVPGELGGAGSSGCFPRDPPAGPATLAPNRP